MGSEYIREIEDAFGVNPAPRQSARLASDLEAIEPFDEMTGPMPKDWLYKPREVSMGHRHFRQIDTGFEWHVYPDGKIDCRQRPGMDWQVVTSTTVADLEQSPYVREIGSASMRPCPKSTPSFRELGLGLFRDGAEQVLDLIEKGLTPAEIREWIGRLA